MPDHIEVTSFCSAPLELQRQGLLGWIGCRYGLLILDGLALRRTATGELVLSYPERRAHSGARHPVYRPINDAARRDIERQVLEILASGEEVVAVP